MIDDTILGDTTSLTRESYKKRDVTKDDALINILKNLQGEVHEFVAKEHRRAKVSREASGGVMVFFILKSQFARLQHSHFVFTLFHRVIAHGAQFPLLGNSRGLRICK